MIASDILFEGVRFKEVLADTRAKGKETAKKLIDAEAKKLEAELRKDLESQGLIISELTLKTGRFRGFFYFSTCKIIAKSKNRKYESEEDASKLLEYLRSTYSTKFKFKSISEDGEVTLNLR